MKASRPARVVRGLYRRALPIGPVIAVETKRPELVLTFDDGPDPDGTIAVLDALAAAEASATFFVLASRVRLYPEILHRVADGGHEIALHGLDHRAFTDFTPRELATRCAQARTAVQDATGAAVRWIRPPYGRLTFGGWRALRAIGLDAVLWGPSLWDSRQADDAARLARAVNGAGPGAIVLGHDAHADERDGVDDGPAPSVDRGSLVSEVIASYRERGLSVVTLGHATEAGRLRRSPVFVR